MFSLPELYFGEGNPIRFSIPFYDKTYEKSSTLKSLQPAALMPGGFASKLVTSDMLTIGNTLKEDPVVKTNRDLFHELAKRLSTLSEYVAAGGAPEVEALYGLSWHEESGAKKSVLKLSINLIPFLALDICSGKDAKKTLAKLREQYHEQIELALRFTRFDWNSLLTRYLPYNQFEDFRIALALIEYVFTGRDALELTACSDVAIMGKDDKHHNIDTIYLVADFISTATYERDDETQNALLHEVLKMTKAGNKAIDNKFKAKSRENSFVQMLSKQAKDGSLFGNKSNGAYLGQKAAAYYLLHTDYNSLLNFTMFEALFFYLSLTQPLLSLENDARLLNPTSVRCANVKKAIPSSAKTQEECFLEELLEKSGIIIDREEVTKPIGKAELRTLTAALQCSEGFEGNSDVPTGVSERAMYAARLLQNVAKDHMAMRQYLWDNSIAAELLEAEKDTLAEDVKSLTKANAEYTKALTDYQRENEELRARIAELEQTVNDMESRTEGNKDVLTLIAAVDEDMEEMRSQIRELQQTNEKLRAENSGLSGKLERMSSDEQPILVHGDEKEFFPGEIRDVVLSILNDAYKKGQNSRKSTRRSDILGDILEANPYEGILEQRAETVKTALVGYTTMDVPLKRRMEDLGFQFKEVTKKHQKALYYGDPRYLYIFAVSGSDKAREGNNIAHDIISLFF